MATLPIISATNPTALEPATYDTWTILSFHVRGDGLVPYGTETSQPVQVQATLVKSRTRPDGVKERSPLPGDQVQIFIPDLYAVADSTTDPTAAAVATAMGAVVNAVIAIGQAQGAL